MIDFMSSNLAFGISALESQLSTVLLDDSVFSASHSRVNLLFLSHSLIFFRSACMSVVYHSSKLISSKKSIIYQIMKIIVDLFY